MNAHCTLYSVTVFSMYLSSIHCSNIEIFKAPVELAFLFKNLNFFEIIL
jgi:hypothetical protein